MPRQFRNSDLFSYEEDDDRNQLLSSDDEWEETSKFMRSNPRYRRKRLFSNVLKAIKTPLGGLLILMVLVSIFGLSLLVHRDSTYIAFLRYSGVPPGLYSKDGVLYVGKDTPFYIKGFNWHGMEEESRVPGGLHSASIERILNFAQNNRFNAIRLPMAVDTIMRNPMVTDGIGIFVNPKVVTQSYLDMAKSVIKAAASKKILVLLDIHRLHAKETQLPGLWYSDTVSEQQLTNAWKKLCDTFRDEWNIIGADLFNEPYKATWNTSDTTDWKKASEHIGNTIHEKCPSWTIFIEGVGSDAGKVKTNVFWAENLRAIQDSPPQLKLRHKVVLSPHVYGPSVYNQTYFKKENFENDMPSLWDDHFGEANKVSGIATVIGEWGGWYVGKDQAWQDKIMQYLIDKEIGFFYWCLNPESSDTGGLFKKNWRTPETKKLELLKAAKSTSVADHELHFMHWRSWRAQP